MDNQHTAILAELLREAEALDAEYEANGEFVAKAKPFLHMLLAGREAGAQ